MKAVLVLFTSILLTFVEAADGGAWTGYHPSYKHGQCRKEYHYCGHQVAAGDLPQPQPSQLRSLVYKCRTHWVRRNSLELIDDCNAKANAAFGRKDINNATCSIGSLGKYECLYNSKPISAGNILGRSDKVMMAALVLVAGYFTLF